jgi:hypothetical protein
MVFAASISIDVTTRSLRPSPSRSGNSGSSWNPDTRTNAIGGRTSGPAPTPAGRGAPKKA